MSARTEDGCQRQSKYGVCEICVCMKFELPRMRVLRVQDNDNDDREQNMEENDQNSEDVEGR